MTPRSFWTGYLKLSLVTCPVALLPATSDSGKVRFHTLNCRTGNRVVTQYVDAETGKPVDEDAEVKGYQQENGETVMLEDEEIAAVALDSARTIDIELFAPRDSIEWIWYDKPHYLVPDGKVGEEAFAVIRGAMDSTATVGIARLVLYRRERAVLLAPRGAGIMLWTLHYGDEVRAPKDYFEGIGTGKSERKLLSLAESLIRERTVPWDARMVDDPVQARLQDLIAARRKDRRPARKTKDEMPEPPRNVVNIMDALRKSIAAESAPRKRR